MEQNQIVENPDAPEYQKEAARALFNLVKHIRLNAEDATEEEGYEIATAIIFQGIIPVIPTLEIFKILENLRAARSLGFQIEHIAPFEERLD